MNPERIDAPERSARQAASPDPVLNVTTGAQPVAEAPAAAKRQVELRDLSAYYGDNHAVKEADLYFSATAVTAIIGPSGCGKSTMVRCINRMHEEIPGARAEGKVTARRDRPLRRGDRRRRGAPRRSGWSSRSPIHSRRCRSSTTSRPGCG